MTPIKEAFETLLPKPVRAFRDKGTFTLAETLYTADQVRQMFDAATERAAKLCDDIGDYESQMRNTQGYQAADACAAAIRGDGGAKA